MPKHLIQLGFCHTPWTGDLLLSEFSLKLYLTEEILPLVHLLRVGAPVICGHFERGMTNTYRVKLNKGTPGSYIPLYTDRARQSDVY